MKWLYVVTFCLVFGLYAGREKFSSHCASNPNIEYRIPNSRDFIISVERSCNMFDGGTTELRMVIDDKSGVILKWYDVDYGFSVYQNDIDVKNGVINIFVKNDLSILSKGEVYGGYNVNIFRLDQMSSDNKDFNDWLKHPYNEESKLWAYSHASKI